jgi:hypothetical protein
MKPLLRVCLLIVPVALIASSGQAGADPVPSVRVRFEVASPSLAQQWGPAASGVVTDVQRVLTKYLKDRFPHWEYEVDATGVVPAFQLLFQVVDDNTGALSVRVHLLRAPNLATPTLIASWLARPEIMLYGYPSPSTAATDIVKAVSTRLFDQYERELRGWLSEYVPIAEGAHWMRETPPRLVLALPWTKYDTLRESVFRLICAWPGQGTAIVDSVGPGLPAGAPYSPPPPAVAPNPPFDGVVVVAREREFLGDRKPVDQIRQDELFQLNPQFIFLKEYRPVVAGWNVVGGQP